MRWEKHHSDFSSHLLISCFTVCYRFFSTFCVCVYTFDKCKTPLQCLDAPFIYMLSSSLTHYQRLFVLNVILTRYAHFSLASLWNITKLVLKHRKEFTSHDPKSCLNKNETHIHIVVAKFKISNIKWCSKLAFFGSIL